MPLALVIALNALFAAAAIGGVLYLAISAARNESRDSARSGAPSPRARRRRVRAQGPAARPLAGPAGASHAGGTS